ncbi:MAG: leucine-rich repeat domain-containing protein [Salinivirgaceae bacterium]|nr:leucine-rich repeat domain-containing protein [Salinivirgaceae bacterium]
MKRLFIILTYIVLAIANALAADNFDFSAVCGSGQTLYYQIVAPNAVEITYPNVTDNWEYMYVGYTRPTGDLTIPDTVINNGVKYAVKSIGQDAFNSCSDITSVSIPNSITSICQYAFIGCNNITSVVVPNSVTDIGFGAFYACDLTTITLPFVGDKRHEPTDTYQYPLGYIFGVGIYSGGTQTAQYYYGNSNTTTTSATYCIPSTLKEVVITGSSYISHFAFNNCKGLTSITISDSVITIGQSAFSGCSGLTSVTIPNSVTSIGYAAFGGCSSLESITLPFVGIIVEQPPYKNRFPFGYFFGEDSYSGGTPTSQDVWNIGSGGGNNHQTYYIPTTLKEVVITGGNIIPRDAFQSCTNLTSISIPNTVTSIGLSAFINCTSLTSITIPNSVLNIGDCAFMSCTSLQSVIIPKSVSRIGDAVFGNCNLQSITIENTIPPVISTNSFLSDVPIYIPCGSLSAYQSAENWGDYSFVEKMMYKFEISSADNDKGSVEIMREPTCEKSAVIQATAETGYVFYQWSDGNKSNPRYLTVTQDTVLTAYFVADEIDVEIASANTAQGTVSNSSGTYHYNDEIEISATANYGYHFARWSDGVTTNQRKVVLKKDTVIEAEFAVNQYTITLKTNNAELGSVSGGGTFNYLSNNEISAAANEGYVFAKWEDGNTSNPRTVSLTCDTTFMAVFVPAECQLQVATSDEVKGFVSNSSGTYHYKDEVEISATANYGYHFTTWSDSVTSNPRTIVLHGDTVIQAQFAANQYAITVGCNNAELGTVSGGGTFDYLATASISATANHGYAFKQWNDGNYDNPRRVTITCDTAFTAIFVPDEVNVEVVSADTVRGKVSALSGTHHYYDTITISATANYGYHFSQWSDSVTANPRTIILRGDTAIQAQFAANQYSITVGCNNAELGTVSGGGTFDYLATASISATANHGYAFKQWNDGNYDNPRRVTITQDTAFTAVFVPDEVSVEVKSADTEHGAVTELSGVYHFNEKIIISAIAVPHYHFVSWSDGNRQNPREVLLRGDTVLTAAFGIDTFSVAAKCDTAMGAVSGAGLYSYGSAAKVEAKPAAHHHFVQWTSGAVQTTQEFVVEHDTAFEAVFAIDRHSVALAASDSLCGAVSGAGSYDYGASVQLQATPAANCYFTGWSDGVTTNPRTLSVEGDTNIVAEFGKLQTVNIMVAANDTLRGTVVGTGSYVVGSNATLSATASAHYLFEQWSDGRTDNPRTVRAIADATYTAVFVPMQYNIILSQNNADMGMVSGSGVYSYGERVSCLAKPYPNYHFVQWSNGETANPYEFVVEEDKMLTAYFAAGAVTALGNESAIEPTIYAIDKTIVVENATEEICVYDAMGKLICRDAIHRVRAELRVNDAGVYIVKTGNVVMRVVVE